MPAPFLQTLRLPIQGQMVEFTSVVADQEDFDRAFEVMKSAFPDEPGLAAIKEAGHLPLAKAGSKTQPLFDMFGVKTEFMSLIVRGTGKKLLEAKDDSNVVHYAITDEVAKAMEAAFQTLPGEVQIVIRNTVNNSVDALLSPTPDRLIQIISTFIRKNGQDKDTIAHMLVAAKESVYETLMRNTNVPEFDPTGYFTRFYTNCYLALNRSVH